MANSPEIEELTASLDFSGNSFFDLWHTHVDWNGKGNRNWHERRKFLELSFEYFERFSNELANYPKDFQLWIDIDHNDSAEDAVYIHTSNLNSENFPIRMKSVTDLGNSELEEYLKNKKDFEIIVGEHSEGKFYSVFKPGMGCPLKEE